VHSTTVWEHENSENAEEEDAFQIPHHYTAEFLALTVSLLTPLARAHIRPKAWPTRQFPRTYSQDSENASRKLTYTWCTRVVLAILHGRRSRGTKSQSRSHFVAVDAPARQLHLKCSATHTFLGTMPCPEATASMTEEFAMAIDTPCARFCNCARRRAPCCSLSTCYVVHMYSISEPADCLLQGLPNRQHSSRNDHSTYMIQHINQSLPRSVERHIKVMIQLAELKKILSKRRYDRVLLDLLGTRPCIQFLWWTNAVTGEGKVELQLTWVLVSFSLATQRLLWAWHSCT
jgi:hypothetical protein